MDEVTTLDQIREFCLSLPGTTERLSHGAPTFFVADKKPYVMYLDNHHDDGRLALWCAAPAGAQAAHIEKSPDGYFAPPYVGHRGWVGVHLNRGTPWEEIAGILEDAYEARVPKKAGKRFD